MYVKKTISCDDLICMIPMYICTFSIDWAIYIYIYIYIYLPTLSFILLQLGTTISNHFLCARVGERERERGGGGSLVKEEEEEEEDGLPG